MINNKQSIGTGAGIDKIRRLLLNSQELSPPYQELKDISNILRNRELVTTYQAIIKNSTTRNQIMNNDLVIFIEKMIRMNLDLLLTYFVNSIFTYNCNDTSYTFDQFDQSF